jgi:hypothetical protein
MAGSRLMTGRLLQLVALSAFAVGRPLLELVADFPGFLVAHRAAPGDIVLLALTLLAAPPLLLFALSRAAGLVSSRAEAIVHRVWVASLSALILLPLAGRWLGDASALALALALAGSLALGALFAFAVARSARLREITELCAAGALVFFGLFLGDVDIRALVFQSEPPAFEAPRVREKTTLVMLIFDELPLSSLQGADRRIDANRFPAFARLAEQSTWFRNATAVASFTQQAVPAILTGRYPGTEPRLAIASEHPDNLFSMLAGSHELNVFESQMQLADPDQLPRPEVARRMQSLFGDLFIVYLHVLLPPSLVRDLPVVNETWKNFAALGPTGAAGDETSYESHPSYFRRFVSSIEADGKAALHFIHSTLPHRPWQYLPSGKLYFPNRQYGLTTHFNTLDGDWWQQEAYQRHLLQLQYVDRLLGELIERLEALDLYERSLIIVTADHGVAFWPDDNARMVGLSNHPEGILSVPLFVKAPDQERGSVDDRNVESVDILPTIADLMGAELPRAGSANARFQFDGCSLFDSACPERPDKVAYWSLDPKPKTMEELRFDPALGLAEEGLRRKLDWFGEGLYRFGPHAALVGRRLETLNVERVSAGHVTLEASPGRSFLDPDKNRVPVRISSLLVLEHEPESTPHVAVAMAGQIQTVVPAPVDGAAGRRVLAMIPEEALLPGASPTLLLVEGTPEQPRLRPLELR